MTGFRKFLVRSNLVDLSVAVVVGVAFSNVVQALIKDLITPLIAAVGGKPNFSNLVFSVNKSHFRYGDFINVARRAGIRDDAAYNAIPNGTVAQLVINGSNTFLFHVEYRGRNLLVNGVVRQDGTGTADGRCVVYGSAVRVP